MACRSVVFAIRSDLKSAKHQSRMRGIIHLGEVIRTKGNQLSTVNCIVSCPENGTTYADEGAAFLDGDGVVLAHVCGQFLKIWIVV